MKRNVLRAPGKLGFTIIELMVVMAILAILATMAMPLAEVAARRSKERELKAALWEIRNALDRYKQAYDDGRVTMRSSGATGYPRTLEDLVITTIDAKTGAPMHFLRRIPRDPFNKDLVSDAATWGLRSYASPADRPKPGDDVYDIYSLSSGAGSNGIAYAKW